MRTLGVMEARGRDTYSRGCDVIVRSNRGLEAGHVLCEATDDALSHLDEPPHGHILRLLTPEDQNELRHLDLQKSAKLEICRRIITDSGLAMQLVDLEQLFGGERIVVYFLSEERIDFRDLVKSLATELQTRIEMRQIGVRDEAKLLADYGDCGQPICCATHLSKMPPVSMKMAKIQKATLDPTKISGRCGRLKCCLRYEFDTYMDLRRELPPLGAQIVTKLGHAKVLDHEILAQQVLIETEDHRRILIEASEVLSVVRRNES
jgi:cell fate regulator YaaT (PSP1 superfamily)